MAKIKLLHHLSHRTQNKNELTSKGWYTAALNLTCTASSGLGLVHFDPPINLFMQDRKQVLFQRSTLKIQNILADYGMKPKMQLQFSHGMFSFHKNEGAFGEYLLALASVQILQWWEPAEEDELLSLTLEAGVGCGFTEGSVSSLKWRWWGNSLFSVVLETRLRWGSEATWQQEDADILSSLS